MKIKPIEYCLIGLINITAHTIAILAYAFFNTISLPDCWLIVPIIYIGQGFYLVSSNINKIDDSRLP